MGHWSRLYITFTDNRLGTHDVDPEVLGPPHWSC